MRSVPGTLWSQSRHSRRRPDHPFAEAVRHWTARRRFQNTQPEAADRGVELPREDAVAVMKQTVVGAKPEGELPAQAQHFCMQRLARLKRQANPPDQFAGESRVGVDRCD